MLSKGPAEMQILKDLQDYWRSCSNQPIDEADAERKLEARGLKTLDIARRRRAFRLATDVGGAAVLASYHLLHGVGPLDSASDGQRLKLHADVIVSLFRAADVCLHNLTALANRIVMDLAESNFGQAAVKITWCNHFHQTLYTISQLASRIDRGRELGSSLSIMDSLAYREYIQSSSELARTLRSSAKEAANDIAEKDLDDLRRFINFHSFVNSNYEEIWANDLWNVRVPGCSSCDGESTTTFFERIVQPNCIRRAVFSVELHEATYLMQFRAYHQISEIVVRVANKWITEAIEQCIQLDPSSDKLLEVEETLEMCCTLLSLITDNIKPIVRTLSPSAYAAIRPALGTTSGSHSNNLRRGLFTTFYPALVRTLRLVVARDESTSDVVVYDRAKYFLQSNDHLPLARTIRHMVSMYQYVRIWRDEHMQFVKTQIGVSRANSIPTASISGSEDAAATADRLRLSHDDDLIRPFYRALRGRDLPAALPVTRPGGIDEYMANLTAEAVHVMYSEVQARVQRNSMTGNG